MTLKKKPFVNIVGKGTSIFSFSDDFNQIQEEFVRYIYFVICKGVQ